MDKRQMLLVLRAHDGFSELPTHTNSIFKQAIYDFINTGDSMFECVFFDDDRILTQVRRGTHWTEYRVLAPYDQERVQAVVQQYYDTMPRQTIAVMLREKP